MTWLLLVLLAQQFPPELPPLQPAIPILWMTVPPPVRDVLPAPPGQPVKVMWLFPANTATNQADATARCTAQATRTNQTYANDPANPTRIQVVACLYVSSVTSTTLTADLMSLVSGPFAAQVQVWRDFYHADLVQMASLQGCGLGYQNAYKYGAPWTASAVNWGCAQTNFSAEHEMGHNEGLTHDIANQEPSADFPDAEGFCDSAHGRRDPMVYPTPCGGNRVAYFGNPDINPFGYPFGDATHNAARVLRQTMPIVANFYPPVAGPITLSVPVFGRVED